MKVYLRALAVLALLTTGVFFGVEVPDIKQAIAPAKAQQACSWNYQLDGSGNAQASYCGSVIEGVNQNAASPPFPSFPYVFRWIDGSAVQQTYRFLVALGNGSGALDSNCSSATCTFSWQGATKLVASATVSTFDQASMLLGNLPTCNASENGAYGTISNGVASATYLAAVGATTGPATRRVACLTADGAAYAWVYD